MLLLVTAKRDVFDTYVNMVGMNPKNVKHVSKMADIQGYDKSTKAKLLYGFVDLDEELLTVIIERFDWERDYTLG